MICLQLIKMQQIVALDKSTEQEKDEGYLSDII